MALKTPKADILEWIDPETKEVHRCPKQYVSSLKRALNIGKGLAQTAGELLKRMDLPVTKGNERHLRQAALYLKKLGVHVISYRSAEGGYYVALDFSDVLEYADQQEKLAHSMLREAKRMRTISISESLSRFNQPL